MRNKLLSLQQEVTDHKRQRTTFSFGKSAYKHIPVFGILVDNDGDPIQGAKVTLLGLYKEAQINAVDSAKITLRTTVTDADGLFHLSLKYDKTDVAATVLTGRVKIKIEFDGEQMITAIGIKSKTPAKAILESIIDISRWKSISETLKLPIISFDKLVSTHYMDGIAVNDHVTFAPMASGQSYLLSQSHGWSGLVNSLGGRKTLPVIGFVKDSDGKPISGATVTLLGVSMEGQANLVDSAKVVHSVSTTNANGLFYLSLTYEGANIGDAIAGYFARVRIDYDGKHMIYDIRARRSNSLIPVLKKMISAAVFKSILKALKLPVRDLSGLMSTNFVDLMSFTPDLRFNPVSEGQSFYTDTLEYISEVDGYRAFGETGFPSPKTIKAHYPAYPGEHCSSSTDECAIRMSIALQGAGVDISGSNKFRQIHKHKGSNIVHQPSAKALADWLHKAIKYPKKYIKKDGTKWQESDFINKEGIIFFLHPEYGGNGPGHIDVISGGKMGSRFYPNSHIWFWEYKGGKYIN